MPNVLEKGGHGSFLRAIGGGRVREKAALGKVVLEDREEFRHLPLTVKSILQSSNCVMTAHGFIQMLDGDLLIILCKVIFFQQSELTIRESHGFLLHAFSFPPLYFPCFVWIG
jgi:hypothetical protein